MKKITIFFLLLVSTNSFAEIFTQTEEDSFGVQGSTDNVSVGKLDETLSISAFDEALGTLTGVTVTVFGQMDSTGYIENKSVASGYASVFLAFTQAWGVSTTFADAVVFEPAAFVPPIFEAESDLLGNSTLTGDQFQYEYHSTEQKYDIQVGVADFSAFTTGDDIDFTFGADMLTHHTITVLSGTGVYESAFQTGSWGKVKVVYEYTTGEVPEPSTIVILGLGVMGLFLNRKKRV